MFKISRAKAVWRGSTCADPRQRRSVALVVPVELVACLEETIDLGDHGDHRVVQVFATTPELIHDALTDQVVVVAVLMRAVKLEEIDARHGLGVEAGLPNHLDELAVELVDSRQTAHGERVEVDTFPVEDVVCQFVENRRVRNGGHAIHPYIETMKPTLLCSADVLPLRDVIII